METDLQEEVKEQEAKVVELQDRLSKAFAIRKAEGTETEGMLAPDDRDMLVRGFESHLIGVVMTAEESKEYCRALEKMPLRLPTKKAVRKIIRACVPPPPVSITAEHGYSLIEMVKYFKDLIAAAEMPVKPGRSDELTSAYCDELLEDLGQ